MTDLEKKLELAAALHGEIQEANRVLMMKSGQLNDLMQDLAVNNLGFPKDAKELALPELLLRAFKSKG